MSETMEYIVSWDIHHQLRGREKGKKEGRTSKLTRNKIHLNRVHRNVLSPILSSPILNAANPPPSFGIFNCACSFAGVLAPPFPLPPTLILLALLELSSLPNLFGI